MERKAVSVMALILLLLVGVLTLAFKTELVSAIVPKYPAIYVDPPVVKGIMPCNNVTVSVKTDYKGDNIEAWQFTLSFNACILHGVNVTNGDIICEGWGPLAKFIPGTFNNTEGTLSLTGAFYFYLGGPIPSPWWGETLANVTFHVVGYGFSNITLGPETKLFGWEPEPPYTQYEIINAETMPDHIGHGYFSNIIPEYPAIYVDPPVVKGIMPGNNVTVSIKTDYSGYDIYAWTFTLSYNPDILQMGIDGLSYADIWTGDDNKKSFEATGKLIVPDSEDVYVGGVPKTKGVDYTIDYRTGMITFTTAPGSGVEVKATYLYCLINGDLITTEKVPTAMFVPGTFNNTLGTLSLTWAVVDFFQMISPPPTTYGPGTLAYVTFTVVGYGTSNITLGHETKLIGRDPILEPQSYSIIDAETMPDHIGHGYFSNILLGDADFNGLVEMPDFYIWRESFGSGPERPLNIPDVDPDFNDDGYVDMYDFYIWREHFGESI